jgi:hypothetical protein
MAKKKSNTTEIALKNPDKPAKTLYWIKGSPVNPEGVLRALENVGIDVRSAEASDITVILKYDNLVLYGVEGTSCNFTFEHTNTFRIISSAGKQLKPYSKKKIYDETHK